MDIQNIFKYHGVKYDCRDETMLQKLRQFSETVMGMKMPDDYKYVYGEPLYFQL